METGGGADASGGVEGGGEGQDDGHGLGHRHGDEPSVDSYRWGRCVPSGVAVLPGMMTPACCTHEPLHAIPGSDMALLDGHALMDKTRTFISAG